ncbi:MAG: YhfC family intramembrane metalloprotease [Hydrogenibacillus sp.]|nr:YhfC family intramembrane metalloprotease [Hydrogenibacillus sp.]
MVPFASLVGMGFQFVSVLLLVIGSAVYLHRRRWLSWAAAGFGALTFFVFALILERALHFIVLGSAGPTRAYLLAHPIAYALYGALAAGLFEEGGRYLVMRRFMTSRRSFGDGLSFGLGHGGLEAVVVLGMTSLSNLALSLQINSGAFDSTLSAPGINEHAREALLALKTTLIQASPIDFYLGGVERLFAFVLQLFFSLLVLYALKARRPRYVLYAVLAHAVVDLVPGYFQATGRVNVYGIEGLLLVYALAAAWGILRIKRCFEQPDA